MTIHPILADPAKCAEITRANFWDAMEFEPVKRNGYSDGPGAVFHGEP